jgi:hypothetical protein
MLGVAKPAQDNDKIAWHQRKRAGMAQLCNNKSVSKPVRRA